VLDEPTSALDVSVQAQILNLLKSLKDRLNLTFLFITHHLLVVKYISDRTAVMYLGKVVEIARTKDLFSNPVHPYTHALLSGIPIPEVGRKKFRIVLAGDVSSPVDPPQGCRFIARCPFTLDQCREEEPKLQEIASNHLVACHRQKEIGRLMEEEFSLKKPAKEVRL
ncbi:MAG: ABC transporter ATP-binding protein, partial [Deltaproteobacteria bacterium]|nr:ABC transporter ATP-binding protein [Deltaproteobacteria bacterium]